MGWIFLKYLHISIFKFRFLEPYFGLCKWGWIMVFLNKIILGVDREWGVDMSTCSAEGWTVLARKRDFSRISSFSLAARWSFKENQVFFYIGCTHTFSMGALYLFQINSLYKRKSALVLLGCICITAGKVALVMRTRTVIFKKREKKSQAWNRLKSRWNRFLGGSQIVQGGCEAVWSK